MSSSAKEIIDIISSFIQDVRYEEDESLPKLLVRDCICNNDLFSEKFDWKPNMSLLEGIKKIITNR